MARRGLFAAEFEQTFDLLEENKDIKKQIMVSNAARFQYAMVTRIDNTANFKEADLTAIINQMQQDKRTGGHPNLRV
jgi:hypothetical protein